MALEKLPEFETTMKTTGGQVKPVVLILVDGRLDENLRYAKALGVAIGHFRRYNLDAIFFTCHAPGQSAYNAIERRMAPLSHDIAGLILPHDHYGSHLDSRGKSPFLRKKFLKSRSSDPC
jgi:hypothetical protein